MLLSRQYLIAIVLTLVGLSCILMTPVSDLLDPTQTVSACLITIALIFYGTSILPEHVTALLFMCAAMLLAVAPADIVFSGFTSTACWLIFAGLIMGIAINETGLAKRAANHFSGALISSYPRLITGIVVLSTLLGFLMPSSMGRAVLFIPIALAMAQFCGFKPGDKGHTGVVLAAAFGCHVPTFAVLPANVPNMVMIGAAENIHQWTPLYTEYLLLHFPVLGFLKGILIIALILWLFPDKPRPDSEKSAPTPLTSRELQLMVIMLITLSLWLSDGWHQISAAWVGLAAACILLLPKVGIVSQKSFNDKFNMSSLIFVAGFLSLGTMINYTGLGGLIGDQLNQLLPLEKSQPFINFTVLSITAFITGIFTTLPGVPAILTPLAEQMSSNSGFSLQAILMTQVFGFSTILFPYQSAPLIVAMQLAKVPLKHAAKLCLLLTGLTLVILLPLDYLWWTLLGWI